jgi:hypothetical protein
MLTMAREAEATIPSAVFAGIVGDASHTYGFHCSARQLRFNRGDYSLANADNWAGGQQYPDAAAAVDLSMNRTDMITVTSRLVASWQDPADDRLDGWYSFIGTLDGVTCGRYVCYPPEWGGPYWADITHTWHIHASARRSMVHNALAMAAFLSVIVGRTYQEWQQGGVLMALDANETRILINTAGLASGMVTMAPAINQQTPAGTTIAQTNALAAKLDEIAAAVGAPAPVTLAPEQVDAVGAAAGLAAAEVVAALAAAVDQVRGEIAALRQQLADRDARLAAALTATP